ncbi:hypothetical protein H0W91_02850 [Patescibacteria group bacterium]|nr:hypothetical protein [Patescibacteria group bacterium]
MTDDRRTELVLDMMRELSKILSEKGLNIKDVEGYYRSELEEALSNTDSTEDEQIKLLHDLDKVYENSRVH